MHSRKHRNIVFRCFFINNSIDNLPNFCERQISRLIAIKGKTFNLHALICEKSRFTNLIQL